jgi:RsiW-degrading membrane proteinase PrsW (M82 family)
VVGELAKLPTARTLVLISDGFLASTTQITFESIAFTFGVYFALMWAVVLYFMLVPRLAFARIVQVSLFTIVVGITLVLALQQLPLISSLYADTNSNSLAANLFGFVCGVGVLEESAKALPIWWLYVHSKNEDKLSTIVFLGCVSGFAFGIAEAARYSISYAFGLKNGSMGFGGYLLAQMTRLITLPLLHAVWAGISAYFVALASVNRHVGKGLLLAGLVITATLHGCYDTFSSSLIGVGIAVLSILMFVAYYRSGQTLQAKITSLLVKQVPELPQA